MQCLKHCNVIQIDQDVDVEDFAENVLLTKWRKTGDNTYGNYVGFLVHRLSVNVHLAAPSLILGTQDATSHQCTWKLNFSYQSIKNLGCRFAFLHSSI